MLKIRRTKGGFVGGLVGGHPRGWNWVDMWAEGWIRAWICGRPPPEGGESERGGRPLVPFRASEWAATQRRERPTRNEEGAGGRQKGGFVGGHPRGWNWVDMWAEGWICGWIRAWICGWVCAWIY